MSVGSFNSRLISGLKLSFLIIFLIVAPIVLTILFKIVKILFSGAWPKLILVVKAKGDFFGSEIDFERVSESNGTFVLERKETELKAQLFKNSYFNYFTNYEKDPIRQFQFIIPSTKILFEIPDALYQENQDLYNIEEFYASKFETFFYANLDKFSRFKPLFLEGLQESFAENFVDSDFTDEELNRSFVEVLVLIEPNVLKPERDLSETADTRSQEFDHKIVLIKKDFEFSFYDKSRFKFQLEVPSWISMIFKKSWNPKSDKLTFYSSSYPPPGFNGDVYLQDPLF